MANLIWRALLCTMLFTRSSAHPEPAPAFLSQPSMIRSGAHAAHSFEHAFKALQSTRRRLNDDWRLDEQPDYDNESRPNFMMGDWSMTGVSQCGQGQCHYFPHAPDYFPSGCTPYINANCSGFRTGWTGADCALSTDEEGPTNQEQRLNSENVNVLHDAGNRRVCRMAFDPFTRVYLVEKYAYANVLPVPPNTDSCTLANNGHCNDGGPGTGDYGNETGWFCDCGTDATDCGTRSDDRSDCSTTIPLVGAIGDIPRKYIVCTYFERSSAGEVNTNFAPECPYKHGCIGGTLTIAEARFAREPSTPLSSINCPFDPSEARDLAAQATEGTEYYDMQYHAYEYWCAGRCGGLSCGDCAKGEIKALPIGVIIAPILSVACFALIVVLVVHMRKRKGCCGSRPDYSEDVGPDGPVSAAPAQLVVAGHGDTAYNGLYSRTLAIYNGKAVFSNGQRYIYYYACGEGGAPGWSFDHREQSDTMGLRDWCAGGYFGLQGGPAYPPLVGNSCLADAECGEANVTITELEVNVPPPAISISGHPKEEANGVYTIGGDLWNSRPHYHKSDGWCFYYYARNEGGAAGWSLHPETVPLGAKDWCDGGWVGPYTYAHPPLGESVGFNCQGRCAVRAASGDPAMAEQVHALMQQHRQSLLQTYAPHVQPAMAQVPI